LVWCGLVLLGGVRWGRWLVSFRWLVCRWVMGIPGRDWVMSAVGWCGLVLLGGVRWGRWLVSFRWLVCRWVMGIPGRDWVMSAVGWCGSVLLGRARWGPLADGVSPVGRAAGWWVSLGDTALGERRRRWASSVGVAAGGIDPAGSVVGWLRAVVRRQRSSRNSTCWRAAGSNLRRTIRSGSLRRFLRVMYV
jgi:hypothetical protein